MDLSYSLQTTIHLMQYSATPSEPSVIFHIQSFYPMKELNALWFEHSIRKELPWDKLPVARTADVYLLDN